MIREAEDYHVLWIHDIRGVNDAGQPDLISGAQVAAYLQAMISGIRRYEETETLPMYMIFLDQHYFEINKSRVWLRVLREPLDYRLDLPDEMAEAERRIHELQDELQRVAKSKGL